jgi:hypothetical protein
VNEHGVHPDWISFTDEQHMTNNAHAATAGMCFVCVCVCRVVCVLTYGMCVCVCDPLLSLFVVDAAALTFEKKNSLFKEAQAMQLIATRFNGMLEAVQNDFVSKLGDMQHQIGTDMHRVCVCVCV